MRLTKFLLLSILVISIRFFCFVPYQLSGYGNIVEMLAILCLVYIFVFGRGEKSKKLIFKRDVVCLIILPFFSAIPCLLYHNQSLFDSLIATRYVLFWLVYFALHKGSLTTDSIIKIILAIGLISAFVYFFQQITYPEYYLFDTPDIIKREIEIRSGLYRFRLFPLNPYILFAFFFYLCESIERRTAKKWIYTLILLLSIYLTLTRQLWFCVAISAFMYPLVYENALNGKKIVTIAISLCLLYILYSNLGNIIGTELITQTKDQFENEDDVRVGSYLFYGLQYWNDLFNILFGNGVPFTGRTAYAAEIEAYQDTLHMYRSDIGIVGQFSMYGLLYVASFAMLYIHLIRNFRYLSTYLKLIIIMTIINIPLGSWDSYPLFMGIFLFIAENDIKKNKSLSV